MRRRQTRIMSLAILLAGVAGAAAPSEVASEAVSIYSDACYHEEAGDMLGDTLYLLGGNREIAVLRTAVGEWKKPVLGEAIVEDQQIRIRFAEGAVDVVFDGTITAGLVTGRFSDTRKNNLGSPVFALKRRSVTDVAPPVCE